MSIILYTDTYATVAQMDQVLVHNDQWNNLDLDNVSGLVPNKESFLISAANVIDNQFVYAGEKTDENQSLEFPRNFGFNDSDVIFGTANQYRVLKNATRVLVEYQLSMKDRGMIQYSTPNGMVQYPKKILYPIQQITALLFPYILKAE